MIKKGIYTYGKPKTLYEEQADLIIGKFCSIADNVTVFLGGDHRTDWLTTFPFYFKSGHPKSKGSVTVGNDVWIGYGTTILSGVKIGNGAAIGACSVVRKDIPDYAVCYGNPVEIKKFRFDEKTISLLNKIAWWDWPVEKIEEAKDILMSDNLNSLLEFWEREII